MASLNKVFLIGNLSREVDLRHTNGGNAIAELGVAVSRKFTVNGQQQEETCFVDVSVWGKTAENCRQYLSKGSQVMIEGRLQLDQWQKDGEKRQKLKVVAENVQFLNNRREQRESLQHRQVEPGYAPMSSPDDEECPF